MRTENEVEEVRRECRSIAWVLLGPHLKYTKRREALVLGYRDQQVIHACQHYRSKYQQILVLLHTMVTVVTYTFSILFYT